MKHFAFLCIGLVLAGASAGAQTSDVKQRVRGVRELAKQGGEAIPRIAAYLVDEDLSVRIEAVKSLVDVGGPKTLDALVTALADNDPEIQIRATDGIVNVYVPGYLKTGFSGTLSRAGTSVRGKFTDTNDQVVDSFVQVRPEAIVALGKVARGGPSMDARANAARAVGVLRGRAALPDLIEALHSKDDKLMYESLIAVQKIGDPAAAPRISFLVKDLAERIQVATLETLGLLREKQAGPDIRDALDHARTVKVRRAALLALAFIADPADHGRFLSNLADKDEGVRAAAAEGLGRSKNPVDRPVLELAFTNERGMSPRLSAAYALVSLGDVNTERYGPLKYLVNALNQKLWRGVASPFLIELAREQNVRQAIYALVPESTRDEKIQLSIVFSRSGGPDSVAFLQTMSVDPDPEVQAEGIRSLRTLRARLP